MNKLIKKITYEMYDDGECRVVVDYDRTPTWNICNIQRITKKEFMAECAKAKKRIKLNNKNI